MIIKRMFDYFLVIVFAVPLAILLFPVVWILIKSTSPGPVIYWSKRVGKDNRLFDMPKFRTMRVDTPEVATHLIDNPSLYLTPVGGFLRRSSIDEIPQIWSIISGHMSLVGPRPALFNEDDLVNLRTQYNVSGLMPGLTGWAQVNGRDSISMEKKVTLDLFYMKNWSLWLDMKIVILTFLMLFRDTFLMLFRDDNVSR